MDKRFEKILHRGRHVHGQKTHEKILKIIIHQGIENENHYKIQLDTQ